MVSSGYIETIDKPTKRSYNEHRKGATDRRLALNSYKEVTASGAKLGGYFFLSFTCINRVISAMINKQN